MPNQNQEKPNVIATIDSRSTVRVTVGVVAGVVASVGLAFYLEVRALYAHIASTTKSIETTIESRHHEVNERIDRKTESRWTREQQDEFREWAKSEHRRLEDGTNCESDPR